MRSLLIPLGLALLITGPARAENWPQWRGPYFNGSTTESNLPSQWSKTENMAWVAPLPGQSSATPVIWEDCVFVSSPEWQGNLGVPEIFRASPTGADGKIYCLSEKGTVVVLDAGNEFKILSTIGMGEAPVRSWIAVGHGALFLRTAKNLYCVRSSSRLEP